jgi:hypothetical protein
MRPAAGVRLRAFYIDYFASPGLGYADAVCANSVSRDSNPVAPTGARAKTPDIQTRFGKVLRTGVLSRGTEGLLTLRWSLERTRLC